MGPRQLHVDLTLAWVEFQRSPKIRDGVFQVVAGIPGDRTLVVRLAQETAGLRITRGNAVRGLERLDRGIQPPGLEVFTATLAEGGYV